MFLKHPNTKDLRILRIYSKSIETKYYHGPHSTKVRTDSNYYEHIHYICHIQTFSKPSSEQECDEDHEPYALHKKIRSKECLLSGNILEMEKKFERLLHAKTLLADICSLLLL